MMDIGKTIQKIRKSKKIKQQDLAANCNISTTFLSQIENNKKDPALTTLKLICQELGMPLPVIFFLSMSEEDIPEEKKQSYGLIHPPMEKYIQTLFET